MPLMADGFGGAAFGADQGGEAFRGECPVAPGEEFFGAAGGGGWAGEVREEGLKRGGGGAAVEIQCHEGPRQVGTGDVEHDPLGELEADAEDIGEGGCEIEGFALFGEAGEALRICGAELRGFGSRGVGRAGGRSADEPPKAAAQVVVAASLQDIGVIRDDILRKQAAKRQGADDGRIAGFGEKGGGAGRKAAAAGQRAGVRGATAGGDLGDLDLADRQRVGEERRTDVDRFVGDDEDDLVRHRRATRQRRGGGAFRLDAGGAEEGGEEFGELSQIVTGRAFEILEARDGGHQDDVQTPLIDGLFKLSKPIGHANTHPLRN